MTFDVIIDSLDYKKIHALMTLMEWKWSGPIGKQNEVPTIDDLRQCASSVLSEVYASKRNHSNCSTGGFHAYKLTHESGRVEYKLHFGFSSI